MPLYTLPNDLRIVGRWQCEYRVAVAKQAAVGCAPLAKLLEQAELVTLRLDSCAIRWRGARGRACRLAVLERAAHFGRKRLPSKNNAAEGIRASLAEELGCGTRTAERGRGSVLLVCRAGRKPDLFQWW